MKKKWMSLVLILPILSVIGIGIYNIYNNQKFWETSATTCISLLFAAILSFYFVQRQTDFRSQKGIFIKLLESLQTIVNDEKSYNFSEVSKEQILMRKREMNNKIKLINDLSRKFSIEEEARFLSSKFSEYDSVIGNHINDLDMLKKMSLDLKRPLDLISQKIFEIMIELYSK